MSLEDIWDNPVASPAKNGPENGDPSPMKRPRQALFLSDSDSDNERPPKRVTPAPPIARPEIDSLFDDLDKEEEDADLRYKPLAPALDLAKLAKEAEAKHARTKSTDPLQPTEEGGSKTVGGASKGQVKGKAGDGEKSTRKVLPKLDEERLVGPEGFPLLIEDIKSFQSKGKGNEHTDLNRLLQIYQFWSHRMYPKTLFKDTVNRVERLCHSKRMQVRLSVWRDDFKGVIKQTKLLDDPDIIDLTEPTPEDDVQMEFKNSPSSSSRATSLPPTTDDDFDIDAVIREEEERLAKVCSSNADSGPNNWNATNDDDWDEMYS